MRRLPAALGIGALVALGMTLPAAHGQSFAPKISPGKAMVETPIPPGSRSPLPALVIRNEGDLRLEAQMVAQSEDPAVADWVSFEPAEFALEPSSNQVVRVAVDVPSGAALGAQRVRLRASTAAPVLANGGLGFNVAVASVIDFRIGWPADGTTALPADAADQASGPGPSTVVLALAVAGVAGVVAYFVAGLVGEIEFQSPVRRRRD